MGGGATGRGDRMSGLFVLIVGISCKFDELNGSVSIGIHFVHVKYVKCHFLLPRLSWNMAANPLKLLT